MSEPEVIECSWQTSDRERFIRAIAAAYSIPVELIMGNAGSSFSLPNGVTFSCPEEWK